MKRLIDFSIALFAILALWPLFLAIAFAVLFNDGLPIIHWSKRVGKNNQFFLMPKFRTMLKTTPQVATHILSNPQQYLTSIGKFLRKTSLDELPQLYSILRGHMSFVGPRPALFNQDDLVALRTEKGIEKLAPGLTGWAQINGRDEIGLDEKVLLDLHYLENKSLFLDIKILAQTLWKVFKKEGISH